MSLTSTQYDSSHVWVTTQTGRYRIDANNTVTAVGGDLLMGSKRLVLTAD